MNPSNLTLALGTYLHRRIIVGEFSPQSHHPEFLIPFQLIDVGHVILRKSTATKLCANWCGAHDWCGAFYLSLPFQDGGKCHMVDRRESEGEEHVAVYGGVGNISNIALRKMRVSRRDSSTNLNCILPSDRQERGTSST